MNCDSDICNSNVDTLQHFTFLLGFLLPPFWEARIIYVVGLLFRILLQV